MTHSNREVVNLLVNQSFIEWVINPTNESNHYWINWIDSHPERKNDVETAKQLIESTKYAEDIKMAEKDYYRILENIMDYKFKQEHSFKKRASGLNFRYLGIAASFILIFLSAFLFHKFYQSDKGLNELTDASNLVVKKTLKGQKLKVNLPDGTVIDLNSESELSYEIPFKTKRYVILKGEAFFEVAEDTLHPFIVTAGNITTKVVGTSFNIRCYSEELKNSVSVVTGKVEVSDTFGNQTKLKPNVQGVFDKKNSKLTIEPFSVEKILNWKYGILSFDETPLEKVFKDLERWYGLDFEIKDQSILSTKYTGTYKNKSLEKVMDGVAFTSGLSYKLDNKTVIVWK